MTYTLYYAPGTASMAVHWALIEMGVPFKAVSLDFDAGEQKRASYLKLNPAGRVPALVIDGQSHGESAALLMLLAERHPGAQLAPPPGDPRRAKWLETMVFLANGVLPAMRDWFYADKDGEPAGAAAVRDLARRRIEGAWTRLDYELGDGRRYLIGDEPGCVDFLAAMLMRWSRNMVKPASDWHALRPYVTRMAALPSYAELCEREGLTPWP
jgi:glutathione S-transferase